MRKSKYWNGSWRLQKLKDWSPKRLVSFKNGFYGQLQIGRKKEKKVLCVTKIMRYCGYDFWGEEEEERRELEREEGGEGRERGGRGSRHGRRSCFTLCPPNPAPPYKPAEIGQQVGSVLLLKTQPGHRYLLSLNTSQVRTAWSAPLLFHSTSNTNQSPPPPTM